MQLDAAVIAETVILAAHLERLREVLGPVERMRSTLTVPGLVDHQHQTASASPRHPHVLQFALRFVAVMRMGDHQRRHRIAGRIGTIQMGGNPNSRTRFVHQFFDPEPLAANDTRRMHHERRGRGRKIR